MKWKKNDRTAAKNATKTHRNEMLKIWNVYRRNTINYMIILLKVPLFFPVQPGMKKMKKKQIFFEFEKIK